MRRAAAFLLSFLLTINIYAQADDDDDIPAEPDWEIFVPELYTRGDQTFMMSLGLAFPTVFFGPGVDNNRHNLSAIGGGGSLIYSYFLTPDISIGGELGGMFIGTVGRNNVFMIPVGVRVCYQFLVAQRFEIPVTMTMGVNWHRYLDQGYFGFFMRLGAAIFYRWNADWSFGLKTSWGWHPQWIANRDQNVHGNFVDLRFAVRYHF